ncbi:MAG: class I SAM-dependent methyltransferase, partial [Thermoanaerobaculia bacterium]
MVKLHIGSGTVALDGWVNVDLEEHPGVDRVLDVRRGLPFDGVSRIFAEHFIEHLTLAEGLQFLGECRRVLAEGGVLRLSTPNLDWVWLSHYRRPGTLASDEAILGCLELNRAFHGWGHRFLYNGPMLESALGASGFARVEPRGYGESPVADLRGLERHEISPPFEGVESLLIVEASGVATADPAAR